MHHHASSGLLQTKSLKNPDKLEYLQLSYISDNHIQMPKLLHFYVPVSENLSSTKVNKTNCASLCTGAAVLTSLIQNQITSYVACILQLHVRTKYGEQKFRQHASLKA